MNYLLGAARHFPNASVFALIPLFLLISSSVYPAVIASIENKEMLIVAEVAAQLRGDIQRDAYANNHQSYRSHLGPTSPTPTDSSSADLPLPNTYPSSSNSSPPPMKTNTNSIPMNSDDDIITATAINPGDQLHTIWSDDTSGNTEVLYKRDGADYDPTTENLSNDAGSSGTVAIAVSDNSVHVVWRDDTTSDILYRRSTDSGGTFDPTINLSNNAGSSNFPAIAISGNNVHVVWDDNTPGNFDVLYRRSTNGGASFTEPTKNLSGNSGDSTFPDIASSGNSVHVVWGDSTPGNFDILYRRSLDNGGTFPNIIKNLSSNAGTSNLPAITALGSNVHVVWNDDTPGNFDILYRRSLDNGGTFPNIIKNLSGNIGQSTRPAIAVSGSNVHVVWNDSTPGILDILYRRSVDGGGTFPNMIKNLSSNADSSFSPGIAVSGNNVYVVWVGITSGDFEILYRTSADNGATFPNVITNLSANTGDSENPALAVS